MSSNPVRVHIAGDLLADHHLYDGIRRPTAGADMPTRFERVWGGAGGLAGLLRVIAQRDRQDSGDAAKQPWEAELIYDDSTEKLLAMTVGSFAVWRGYPTSAEDKTLVWRLSEPLGYSASSGTVPPPRLSTFEAAEPAILVLDDAGRGFRLDSHRGSWPKALEAKPGAASPWVVLKMSSPLAEGDLWRALREQWKERLIVVVSIDDLRREEVLVSKGVSWERTALDLAFELQCNPAVRGLLDCRHLVVALGSEGALHVSREGKGPHQFQLVYDPEHLEGEAVGRMEGSSVGFLSCLTAAIVRQFALLGSTTGIDRKAERELLRDGIKAGLSAARRLRELGHGPVSGAAPGFPFAGIAEVVRGIGRVRFEMVEVPAPDESCMTPDAPWAIVTATQERRPLYGLAARVARNGLGQFGGVPFLRFGKLFTVDRPEIESLRALQRLVVDYLRSDTEDRPLSLAAFGPPGAGKSFGVKQLAKAMYTRELRKEAPILEFNLSQFNGPTELVGAFHAIRDKVLEGVTPVVFWDEFDSGEYKWLQNLLAPMQDGKFNEGQLVHPIGKCIFVFAGGTSHDFEHFGPPNTDGMKYHEFKLKKGPDFMSRLSGTLNVLGPNQREGDAGDICFPIRRALLIRSAMGLGDHEKLDMDSGILAALLELKKYEHGARSLEKIVLQMKTHRDGRALRRSALPPRELVGMHADYDELRRIANRDLQFRSLGEAMAPNIHEAWRQNKIADLTKAKKSLDFRYNCGFDELPTWVREENVAAAVRIPRILAMVGLRVVPADDPAICDVDLIRNVLESHLEFLSEEEHDGWMDHKLRNGWRLGPRSDQDRLHDNLIPYRDLTDPVKKYDRNAVLQFPQSVATGGFKIVRTGDGGKLT